MTLCRISLPFYFYCFITYISLNGLIQLIFTLWFDPKPNYLPYSVTLSSITSHFIGISYSFFIFINALSLNYSCYLVYMFWQRERFLLMHIHTLPFKNIKSSRSISSLFFKLPFKLNCTYSSLIIIYIYYENSNSQSIIFYLYYNLPFQSYQIQKFEMLQYFSEHKSIEDNQYTIEDFLFRWKKLQRVLSKESVDGLLLATGLDARDCVQSAYLFNWLFLGLSGKSITINKYLDTIYSEIIVIISSVHNYVFITPQAKAQLETLIYAIPNCTVFCPTEKEYDNKELLDTLKIATFYRMVQKINKIGVFLGENEDVKTIQKWPLVQSYALEPVGKTFFTLKHQAVNIGSKIINLFKNFDRHALKNLSGRTAYSMEGHIKGSITSIELKNLKERGSITELSLQESLQEAVDIGLFESGTSEYKGLVRVLFGNRTNSNENISGSSTVNEEHAEHLTIEHFDPYTKMKVWRTYFLNLATKVEKTVSMETEEEKDSFLNKTFYEMKEKKNVHYDDQNCLISLYAGLVQAVNESISSVSKDYRNLNKQFLHQFILSKVNQVSTQIYKSEVFKKEDLLIDIESYDSFGEPRPIDFKDSISFKLASTFYVIKCKILNVVSPNNNKNKLGALIFSQNFIIQEGCYLLLTKSIPYFDFWKCGGETDETLSSLNPNYDFLKLGKPLSNEGFKNKMFIPCQKMSNYHFNIPVLDVKYYFHENGFRIFNEKIGWHMIFFDEIKDMTMINKISGEWVIMKTQNPLVFDSLETHILTLQFRGKPFDFLMNLTKRKVNPVVLNFIETIPPLLSENWQFTQQILKKSVKDGALIHQSQILVKEFLWSFIQSKQLMIINQMKDIKLANFKSIFSKKMERKKDNVENIEKHNIVVLNGTYGSSKYKLACNLKKFGPNHIKCSIFNIAPDNLYNRISPEAFIDMIEEHINASDIPLEKDQVTIVIIPSWMNSTETLPLLGQKFHIRSVLTKVSSNNFFSNQNMDLVQDVLVFGLPGYSQNIVVDSYAEEQSLINSVIRIVGTYNRQIRVARCTNSLLTTGQCSDILQNSSYQGQYQTFLRQKYGAFYHFPQLTKTQLNYIEFNLPIHDLQKLKKFYKSEGYLIDRKAVIKELEHKKKQAENSKDDLMMGLYFLEQVMAIVRKRQKVTQIRSIKGLVKTKREKDSEETLIRDISWANSEFKEEDSRSVERPLGFSILSVRFDEIEVKKFIETLSQKNVLFGEAESVRTLQSLSEEQKKEIEKDAIENQKCFEKGEYYDGYVLRDAQGFAIEGHPYLEKVYEKWVSEENQRIMKRNNEIKNSWNEYCAKNK